jgi:oligoendopeptidase F
MAVALEVPGKKTRQFVAEDFVVTDWEQLLPYFETLMEMPLETQADIEHWLHCSSELGAVLDEDRAWRFIKMTCNTTDEEIKQRYDHFTSNILPQWSIKDNELRIKLYNSPAFAALDDDKYLIVKRSVKKRIELFKEENVPLQTKIGIRSREFDEIASSLSVEYKGERMTLQKAAALLEDSDRTVREEIWRKIMEARLEKKAELDKLFDDLAELRGQVAKNAGYASFADFKFDALGRFDYTRKDCFDFHRAIEEVVKPQLVARARVRQQNLGLEALRPWDLNVDEQSKGALKPFIGTQDLIDKSIRLFQKLDPVFASQFGLMRDMGYLDLESRMGKAPGGYNYSLAETGVPFIFMNAVGTQGDLTTMLHEIGHAVHSFATHFIKIGEFKHMPAEIAELASMSMELITLDFLDEFYPDSADLKRAKREQLIRPLTLLPWIAAIDAFQFWVYDHPGHSVEEREQAWKEIFLRFHGDQVNWDGLEDVLKNYWQKQGHVFDLPFYYIEYGIAQLGAIAVWRNYRLHQEKGLADYKHALALGYTRPIPEIYAAAGVKFEFSAAYIQELISFLVAEIDQLEGANG